MYRRTLELLAAASLCASCASPDIGPEVAAFSGAADRASALMTPPLERQAANERLRAREVAIRAHRSVHVLSSGCSDLQQGVPGAELRSCVLQPRTQPQPGHDEATRVVSINAALQRYLAALKELAEAKTSADIGASTALLLTRVDGLAKALPASSLTKVAGAIGKDSSAIGTLAQRAAEAARFSALRRAVIAADPAVASAADTLIAYARKHQNAEADAAYEALLSADAAMRTARTQSSTSEYRNAVTRAERAWANYVRVAGRSPVMTITELRNTHHALARRLAAPADTEATIDFLTQLKSLSDIVENIK